MRRRIYEITLKIEKLNLEKFKLLEIRKSILTFESIINSSEREAIGEAKKLFNARRNLNNAIDLIKSNFEIEPGGNPYIEDAEKKKQVISTLNAYLGISNAILDTYVKELFGFEKVGDLVRDAGADLKINMFRQNMKEYCETLIINPLERAYLKYNAYKPKTMKDGKTEVKDFNLFSYFLFYEFFNGASIVGSPTRQINVAQKTITLPSDKSGVTPRPSSFPENVVTDYTTEEKSMRELKDPFEESEDMEVENVAMA